MRSFDGEQLWILSLVPGRVRLHLPGWRAGGADAVETRLGRLPGVRWVRANPLTKNVLIHFDPKATTERQLLAAAGSRGGLFEDPHLFAHRFPKRSSPPPARSGNRLLRAG